MAATNEVLQTYESFIIINNFRYSTSLQNHTNSFTVAHLRYSPVLQRLTWLSSNCATFETLAHRITGEATISTQLSLKRD